MSSTMEEPIACTLGADDLKARLERIANLGQRHLRSKRADGTRIHLHYAPEAAEELREIVGLERQCCSFLRFDLGARSAGVALTITAPAAAGELAPMLFEHFAAGPATRATACTPSCGCARSRQ